MPINISHRDGYLLWWGLLWGLLGNACSSTSKTSSCPPPPSLTMLLSGPSLTLSPLSSHGILPFLRCISQETSPPHGWAQPCPVVGPLEPSGTSQKHLEVVASGTGQPHPVLTELPTDGAVYSRARAAAPRTEAAVLGKEVSPFSGCHYFLWLRLQQWPAWCWCQCRCHQAVRSMQQPSRAGK